MKLLQHVELDGVSPSIVLALLVAKSVYNEHGYEMTVTSLKDGTHSRTSLHYSGNAVDLRTIYIPLDKVSEIHSEIAYRLPKNQFDVILEPTHIHIEFQPKKT